jgi:hypothetical protein
MGSYSFYNQSVAGGNFGVGSAQTDNPLNGLSGLTANVLPGLVIKNFGYNDLYSPTANVGPASAFVNMGYYQNRVNPSTNLIYILGKHTIDVGGGYSYTQLNIDNNRAGIALITFHGLDNFLTGTVHDSNVLESSIKSTDPNNADRYYRSNEFSWYTQDKWQALTNLSITFGVRFDSHGGLTEKHGNMFNFDPSLYSASGTSTTGITINNSGLIVAGNNKLAPSQGVSNSTLTGRQWGISPRVGFAWSPKKFNSKLVVSGGAGIYYDRGELFSYLSMPAGGSIGGPFGVTESAPLVSYVQGYPSSSLSLENPLGTMAYAAPVDSGTSNTGGIYFAPSANPSQLTNQLQLQLNNMTKYSSSYGKYCGGLDSQEYYLQCTSTLNLGFYDRGNVLPYSMNYTFNVQWQPTPTVALLLGYSGNRGRHAVIPIPFNEAQIATATNPIWGETSSYGFEVLNQKSFTLDGYDYDPITVEPWNTASGGNTDFRVPYIGYNPNSADFKTVGVSAYDALDVHVEKRLSHHFQVGGSYTWSHALDEQSDIGLFFTGDDPAHLRDSWASSDFDRTHVFSANFQVDVPNTVKAHSVASYVVNDWHFAGTVILQSGEPYSLYEFYGAVGSIKVGDYPNLMNPILGIKDPKHPKNALTGNKGSFRGTGGNYIPSIDPSQIAISYLQPGTNGIPVSTGNDPADIYETAFNVGQRNIFRQPSQRRADISFRKEFHLTEKIRAQYEFNIFNLTNTTSLDVPQNQAQIRQNSACSTSATLAGGNCTPGQYYFVNYGQIVTANNPTDQQSALANLDQLPFSTGTGKSTQLSPYLSNGQGNCNSAAYIVGTTSCPNNAAFFGSTTGTIGGSRAITMGFHITY